MRTSIQNLISQMRVVANDIENGNLDGASVWVDGPKLAFLIRAQIHQLEFALKVPAYPQSDLVYSPPLKKEKAA